MTQIVERIKRSRDDHGCGRALARSNGVSRELRGRPSILLVNPFAEERDMYAQLLGFSGFEVAAYEDAAAALSFAREHHTDAVIARILQRGSMNGVALTRTIKHDARSAHIPVIIITSQIQPYLRTAAKAAGCDAFLMLPCVPERLVSEVRRVIGNSRRREPHTE